MLTGARARSNKKDKGEERASRTKNPSEREEKQEPKRQTQAGETGVRKRGRERKGGVDKNEERIQSPWQQSIQHADCFSSAYIPAAHCRPFINPMLLPHHTIPDPDPIPSNPQPNPTAGSIHLRDPQPNPLAIPCPAAPSPSATTPPHLPNPAPLHQPPQPALLQPNHSAQLPCPHLPLLANPTRTRTPNLTRTRTLNQV